MNPENLPSAARRLAVGAAIVLATGLLFVAGSELRARLGIEFSLEGLERLRAWILGLGWRGPLAFTLLVTFRGFLFIPSHVVLILGGVVFGPLGGTAWGALGLVLSALLQFGAARLLGDDWVQPRLGANGRAVEARGASHGASRETSRAENVESRFASVSRGGGGGAREDGGGAGDESADDSRVDRRGGRRRGSTTTCTRTRTRTRTTTTCCSWTRTRTRRR